jgi:hypothetical protein
MQHNGVCPSSPGASIVNIYATRLIPTDHACYYKAAVIIIMQAAGSCVIDEINQLFINQNVDQLRFCCFEQYSSCPSTAAQAQHTAAAVA